MPALTSSLRCQASSVFWAKEGLKDCIGPLTPSPCPLETLPTPRQDPLAARKTSQAILWEAEAWTWLRIRDKARGRVQTKTVIIC